jgi:Transposase DDE domain
VFGEGLQCPHNRRLHIIFQYVSFFVAYSALQHVRVTKEAYGPVTTICGWAKGCEEPVYLVSNLASGHAACHYYQKRYRIETFFSDPKSRGFHLHKSHISKADRLSRLLIACCLAC